MKMLTILAAGAVALTGLAPIAPASAQHTRTVVHERTVVRHDGGPRYRQRAHRTRQVCTTKIRHHKRIRICRTVRR